VRAVEAASVGEVLQGLWRFESVHPEWTEEEGSEEGWEPDVAWWALAGPSGLVLIDPLVFDWPGLDRLVEDRGGCAGIVRTCHWHQRSIAEAAARYGAAVWAEPPAGDTPSHPFDHPVTAGQELIDGLVAHDVERADEIALWLPAQAALLFGDAMLRTGSGELRVCPDSWLQPDGGPARLRAVLAHLAELPVEHVLVSHGPLVLGDGGASLRAALD
jgi:glyoxylase-like metal-dependent hydrolase (beta-lactamase superfamily II)